MSLFILPPYLRSQQQTRRTPQLLFHGPATVAFVAFPHHEPQGAQRRHSSRRGSQIGAAPEKRQGRSGGTGGTATGTTVTTTSTTTPAATTSTAGSFSSGGKGSHQNQGVVEGAELPEPALTRRCCGITTTHATTALVVVVSRRRPQGASVA